MSLFWLVIAFFYHASESYFKFPGSFSVEQFRKRIPAPQRVN